MKIVTKTLLACAAAAALICTANATNVTLLSEDFESGLGSWGISGGTRYYDFSPSTNQPADDGINYSSGTGTGAANLPGNNSFLTIPTALDLTGYTNVTISFNDKFFAGSTSRRARLSYSTDGGNTWTFLGQWDSGESGGNAIQRDASVTLTASGFTRTGPWNSDTLPAMTPIYAGAAFTDNTLFRFGFNTSNSGHHVYIDNIVITATTGDAYDTYASGITSGPTGFADDANGDGVANGLHFVLGGDADVVDNSILPTAQAQPNGDFTFQFERADDAVGITTLIFQWGNDLAGWNDVPVLAASSPANGDGVTVDVSGGTPNDGITITVPAANAPNGRIFGRLSATRP